MSRNYKDDWENRWTEDDTQDVIAGLIAIAIVGGVWGLLKLVGVV